MDAPIRRAHLLLSLLLPFPPPPNDPSTVVPFEVLVPSLPSLVPRGHRRNPGVWASDPTRSAPLYAVWGRPDLCPFRRGRPTRTRPPESMGLFGQTKGVERRVPVLGSVRCRTVTSGKGYGLADGPDRVTPPFVCFRSRVVEVGCRRK